MTAPRILFPAFLSLLLAGPAQAQTAPADTARFSKHHLGLTASPQLERFFTANRSLPVGLIYQRQLTRTKALRLRLVGRYRSVDSTNFVGALAGTGTQAWQVLGFAGYEWQHRLGRRFWAHYGAELGGGLGRNTRRSVQNYFNDQGPFNEDVSYTIKTWQVQARPFAGINFQMSPRTSLFLETAAPITYAWKREGYSGYFNQGYFANPGVFNYGGGYSDYKSTRLSIELQLIQFVGISCQF